MPNPLRVLIVEDSEADAALLVRHLEKNSFKPIHRRVDKEKELKEALNAQTWDIILCDYQMPGFSGMDALHIVRNHDEDLPFIFVSGTMGEDLAVEAMRSGAHDYVMKDNLTRLAPAIRRELVEAESRREKKEVEEELMRSYLKHTSLINAIDGIVWEADAVTTQFTFVSAKAERLLKYPLDQWLREPTFWKDHIHPDDREQAVALCAQATAEMRDHDFEYRMIAADGRIVWIRDIVQVVVEDRKPVCLRGIMVDITGQKQAEIEVRESEDRYRDLVENSQDLLCTHDLDGRLLSVNGAAVRLTGYSREALLHMNMADLLVPGVRRMFAAYLRKIRTTGQAKGLLQIQTAGGEIRIWEYDNTLRTEGVSDPIVRGMAHDITERTSAEQARELAEESLRLFRELIDNSNDAFEVVDPDTGRYLDVNVRGLLDLGYSRKEFLNLTVFDVDPMVDQSTFTRSMEEIRKTDTLTWEGVHRRKDGSTFPVEVNLKYVKLDRYYLVCVVRNITERKRAEEQARLLMHTLKSVSECVSITDMNDNILFVNNAFLTTYGFGEKDLLGNNISLVRLPSIARDTALNIIHTATLKGGWSGELTNRAKDGREFPVSLSTSVVRDEEGRDVALVGVATDITKRKQVEERLRQKDNQLRKLFVNVPDLIFQFMRKPDGTYCLPIASEGIRNIFGCSPEDVREDFAPINRVIHPEDRAGVINDIEYSAKHLTLFACEFRVQMPGEGILWMRSQSTPEKLPDGNIIWYGYVTDITERKLIEEANKRSEEALRESEDRYRQLVELSPDSIVIHTDGKVVFANNATLKMFGAKKKEEILGRSILDFVHPDFRQTVRNRVHALVSEQHAVPMIEEKFLRLDGTPVPVEVAAIPFTFDGNPSVQVIARDITKRKAAEDALVFERNLLNALMENTLDQIYFKDTESRFIRLSKAQSRKYGLNDAADAIGKTDFDFHGAEHARQARNDELEIMKTGRSVVNKEEKETWPDGSETWVSSTKTPFYDREGRIMGTFGISRNITARKKIEETLQKSEQTLRLIFDNVFDGICIFEEADDPAKRRLIECNDQYAALAGRSRKELLEIGTTQDISKSLSKDNRDSIEHGSVFTGLYSWIRPDGKDNVIEYTAVPMSQDGKKYSIGIDRDITERKRAEQEHLAHLRFLESIERINRAMQGTNDLQKMTSDVLAVVLSIFDCDRAWLLYPCDPDAPSFRVPMEITKPEYPGAKVLNADVPLSPGEVQNMREALESEAPVIYVAGTERPISTAKQFGVQSQMFVPVYPKTGKPWMFGLHQCSCPRVWTREEERLFQEIGRRLSDALGSLLVYRDLQESEAKFATAFRSSPSAMSVSSAKSRVYLDVNESFLQMTDYEQAEVLGHTAADLNLWAIPEQAKRYWQLLEEHGSVHNFELAFRSKIGEVKYLMMSATTITLNGETCILAQSSDITERMRAEEVLRVSEEKFRRIFENVQDVYYETSLDGTILEISPSIELVSKGQYRRNDLIGHSMAEYLANTEDSQLILSAIRERGIIADHEALMKNRDGSLIYCSISAKLWLDGQGHPQSIMGSMRDITTRKLAEDELRDSEDRYRLLVDIMPVGVAVHVAGKIVYSNPAGARLLGISEPEKLVGKSIEEIVHPSRLPSSRDRIKRLHAGESGLYPVEDLYVRADGSVLPVEVMAVPITYQGHRGTQVVVRDISERKEFEIAMQREEQKYRTLFESNPRPMWVYDLDTLNFLAINDVALKSYGYTRAEMLAMTIKDIRPASEVQRLVNNIANQTEGTDKSGPWIHRTKDGREFPAEISSHTIDFEGRAARLVFVTDLTEKVKQEEEHRKLLYAIEQSPVSIVMTDTEGVIEYVNSRFTEVTGYAATEAVGEKPSILKSGYTKPEEYRVLWETITAGKQWQGTFHNKKKNGDLFWESATISPLSNAQGKIVNFIAVKEDITEKKAMEDRVFRSQRLESLGTLAGGIAHDLNNVLAPVLMSMEIMKRNFTDANSRKLLDAIDASARRGKEVVKQVLSFARGMSGEPAILQPKHIVREIESIIRETFPRNIDVRIAAGRDISTVKADATQLHQVLMNLCVNARDAMPDGGKLTIGIRDVEVTPDMIKGYPGVTAGPFVELAVSDTGTGMPPKVIERVFDPFFTTKGIGEGTGLGLSTVHSIVKSHGGFVEIESVVGTGSTFFVRLPAQKGSIDPSSAERAAEIGHGETILVVDDEDSIRVLAQMVLESKGFHVFTAGDGTEAVALLAHKIKEVSLVITDVMMPFMDGPATIRALRKMNPALKFIAVSGMMSLDGSAAHIEQEVDAMLAKPFTEATLLNAVAQALKKKSPAG